MRGMKNVVALTVVGIALAILTMFQVQNAVTGEPTILLILAALLIVLIVVDHYMSK